MNILVRISSMSKSILFLALLSLSSVVISGEHVFLLNGDLPVYTPTASGHQGPEGGFRLNAPRLAAIFHKLKFPTMTSMIRRLDSLKAFNPHQPSEKKVAGAYLAYSVAAKFVLLPPSLFKTKLSAAQAYGSLKLAGMSNDAAKVRQLLSQFGGSTQGLSDADLTYLWGSNEHQNLHAIVFGNADVRNAIHATSLNDKEMTPGIKRKTLGGYNDKGEYEQWGWYDAIKTYNAKLKPLGSK
jgi:hypothetical protein